MTQDNSDRQLLEQISSDVKGLEKITKLLVVNSLIDELDDISPCLDAEISEKLSELGYNVGKIVSYAGVQLLRITVPEKADTNDIIDIYEMFNDESPSGIELEPVFEFCKINANRRKKLLENKISFCVMGKELHVFDMKGAK